MDDDIKAWIKQLIRKAADSTVPEDGQLWAQAARDAAAASATMTWHDNHEDEPDV